MNPLSFIIETINRITAKSPKYFRIWQLIMACLALAGYSPSILSLFHIHTSAEFVGTTKTIGTYFMGFFSASLLTTQSKAIAMTESGEILKKTDENKLPFTAKVEEKAAEKTDLKPCDIK